MQLITDRTATAVELVAQTPAVVVAQVVAVVLLAAAALLLLDIKREKNKWQPYKQLQSTTQGL
jgi:hypothetical protein